MAEPNSSISNFKRFLIRILLPLMLTIGVVGVTFDYFFEKKIIFSSEMCGAYKVNRILTETHPDEIPILGSSRAEGGFIPDSLGPNYFNYGISSTKYDVTLFFLEQECLKTKKNPWIIINLDLEGLRYGLGDIASYVPNSNNPAVHKLLGRSNRFYYSVPLIKYYGRLETYTRNYLNNRINLTKFTNKGAAIEKNELPKNEFDALIMERKKTVPEFKTDSGLKAKMLGLIAKYANRNFVFVVAPCHQSYIEQYKNMADAQNFMNMLRSYPNVKVFDFSRLPLTNDMYMNTTHINYKGAVVFDHILKDTLRSIGVR